MYFMIKFVIIVFEYINLFIEEGEFVFFFGLSGCGKMMFLLIIVGLIELMFGFVIIDGENIGILVLNIGYMF